jgi:hypothetical protein
MKNGSMWEVKYRCQYSRCCGWDEIINTITRDREFTTLVANVSQKFSRNLGIQVGPWMMCDMPIKVL